MRLQTTRLNVILMVEYPSAWRVRIPGTFKIVNVPKRAGVALSRTAGIYTYVLSAPTQLCVDLKLIGGGTQ